MKEGMEGVCVNNSQDFLRNYKEQFLGSLILKVDLVMFLHSTIPVPTI